MITVDTFGGTCTPANQRLDLRPVACLRGLRFVVPSYQRGYRWRTREVDQLLRDLTEFESSRGAFYCLQPLVVKRIAMDEYEVVDGQQRLTTIYLILKYLKPDCKPFGMRYERHSGDIEELLSDCDSLQNADQHFLREARSTIADWFKDKAAGVTLECLSIKTEKPYAAFIWNELHDAQIDAFMRLNAGKIRLTDAELIRAAMLQSGSGLQDSDRQRIALRWDQMERRLHDPEFWAFLNGDKHLEDSAVDAQALENRITLLFTALEPECKGERAVFDTVYTTRINTSSGRTSFWKEVERLFMTLEEWFEDRELFHLVGYLIQRNRSIHDLRKAMRTARKSETVKWLKQAIRNIALPDVQESCVKDYLDELNYDDHKSQIRHLLLCLNLATICEDTTGTVRFSFHEYTSRSWDIEHIRANASEKPEDNDLRNRVRELIEIANSEPDATAMSAVETSDRGGLLTQYDALCRELDGKEIDAEGGLGNLTLLDSSTNRSYKNGPFAEKRRHILALERQAKYCLPVTRNVFTKAYSKAPKHLHSWTQSDADNYLEAMTETLRRFFWGSAQ